MSEGKKNYEENAVKKERERETKAEREGAGKEWKAKDVDCERVR